MILDTRALGLQRTWGGVTEAIYGEWVAVGRCAPIARYCTAPTSAGAQPARCRS